MPESTRRLFVDPATLLYIRCCCDMDTAGRNIDHDRRSIDSLLRWRQEALPFHSKSRVIVGNYENTGRKCEQDKVGVEMGSSKNQRA